MASETEVEPLPELRSTWSCRAGAVSGFVATVAMGLAIVAVDVETLRVAVAGLYGFEGSLLAGWLAHLVHGTLFGVLFAAVAADPALHEVSERRWRTCLAGVGYGLGLALAGTGIVLPIWLAVLGVPGVPSIPHVTAATVTWHLVYGAVLGWLFASLERR